MVGRTKMKCLKYLSYLKKIFNIDDCIESIERSPGEEEENGDDSEEDVRPLPSG